LQQNKKKARAGIEIVHVLVYCNGYSESEGWRKAEGVRVMKDKDLKLEETNIYVYIYVCIFTTNKYAYIQKQRAPSSPTILCR
jgi:hypothetical protein